MMFDLDHYTHLKIYRLSVKLDNFLGKKFNVMEPEYFDVATMCIKCTIAKFPLVPTELAIYEDYLLLIWNLKEPLLLDNWAIKDMAIDNFHNYISQIPFFKNVSEDDIDFDFTMFYNHQNGLIRDILGISMEISSTPLSFYEPPLEPNASFNVKDYR